ncbi:MAG TPA: hypothetical protein VLA93_06495 [Pyrinomonadaceae bacterium]|nr:hypothetical protein [Pyrinomonadaceae bacterium]
MRSGSVVICRGVPPWAPHLRTSIDTSGAPTEGGPYKLRLLLMLFLSLVAAPTVLAQAERGADDITVRSMNLRLILERAHRPRASDKIEQAVEELQEDFTRLQVLNLEFVKAINAPKLDYKFVAKSAGEINKRADRLKNNLDLPEPNGVKSAPAASINTELEMKKSMLRLGKLIYSFSRNPFFKEASVVNDNAVQARRELDEILDLSKQIKIDSEKLKKTTVNK